jgi:hypothetical protein
VSLQVKFPESLEELVRKAKARGALERVTTANFWRWMLKARKFGKKTPPEFRWTLDVGEFAPLYVLVRDAADGSVVLDYGLSRSLP